MNLLPETVTIHILLVLATIAVIVGFGALVSTPPRGSALSRWLATAATIALSTLVIVLTEPLTRCAVLELWAIVIAWSIASSGDEGAWQAAWHYLGSATVGVALAGFAALLAANGEGALASLLAAVGCGLLAGLFPTAGAIALHSLGNGGHSGRAMALLLLVPMTTLESLLAGPATTSNLLVGCVIIALGVFAAGRGDDPSFATHPIWGGISMIGLAMGGDTLPIVHVMVIAHALSRALHLRGRATSERSPFAWFCRSIALAPLAPSALMLGAIAVLEETLQAGSRTVAAIIAIGLLANTVAMVREALIDRSGSTPPTRLTRTLLAVMVVIILALIVLPQLESYGTLAIAVSDE